MDSILTSIKNYLGGISEENTAFDDEIIQHINASLEVLTDMGVGPDGGMHISDKTITWADLNLEQDLIWMIESYIGIKVKLIFDQTLPSSYVSILNARADEYEWRIYTKADKSKWGD